MNSSHVYYPIPYDLVYLSILSPAQARSAHKSYWAAVDRDLEAREFFFAWVRLEMLLLVVLH
jgi:hypothetical protein